MDHLADRGLLAYGQSDASNLTDRNADRVRILKFLARHPEGVSQTGLVHYVLKGVAPTDDATGYDLAGDFYDRHDASASRVWTGSRWTALDGSDPDYQFTNRFINDLADHADETGERLVRIESHASDDVRDRWLYPTPALLDLITVGICQTPTLPNDLVYDRDFAEDLLKSLYGRRETGGFGALDLTDGQKQWLVDAFRRYIQRIEDYRLVFDVHLGGHRGEDLRRMTKDYKTRFTDSGRRDRAFARLRASLEVGFDPTFNRRQNAVLVTLTTDPKKHDSLWHAIQAINPNWNNLNSWFKTDPSTVKNTRETDVVGWRPELDSSEYDYASPPFGVPTGGPRAGPVSGRPRESLEYVKILEFDGGGKPHLHVLMFDVPTRESDGMPWLCDKRELSYQWNRDRGDRSGQGQIVDVYPLTYRDDLDEIGNFGGRPLLDDTGEALLDADGNVRREPVSEGFVCWYQHGDHGHDQEWIDDRIRYHDRNGQIDMTGAESNPRQKTAGAYLGKYLGKMYETLQSIDDWSTDLEADVDAGDDDAALWKLAMYWATGRQLWAPSHGIRDEIALDRDRGDVRRGVRSATRTSLELAAERAHEPHARRPDLEDFDVEGFSHRLTREILAERWLAESDDNRIEATALARIDYLGAYHFDDLPPRSDIRVRSEVVEQAIHDPDTPIALASRGDRPPPVEDAW